ncbi:MAG: hypothetical protein IVW53_04090 [Chloroflexi bacterium]|nr:hypothetical protein [Chloroflexota bacterium]
MNRAPTGIPVGHRRVRSLPILAAVVLVAAACGSVTAPPSVSTNPSATPAGVASASPALPGDTASPGPGSGSAGPSGSGSPPPTASGSPVPSGADSAAAACSGSAATKDFFVAIAQAVQWPVYCAVMPTGWSIVSGSYRLANGGQMNVEYRNQSGWTFELKEGHWCTDGASACSPHDLFVGPSAFGDRQGELGSLGGGFVLYVDAGSNPSWTARGTGLDQATFSALCAALALVAA